MKQCNAMESCKMFMTFFPYVVILSSSFAEKRICWSLVLRISKISLILFSKVCILLTKKFWVFVRLSKVSDKSSKDFVENLLVGLLVQVRS